MAQPGSGWRNWGDHPVVVTLTILGVLITIVVFVSGKQNLSAIVGELRLSKPSTITPTPIANNFIPDTPKPLANEEGWAEVSCNPLKVTGSFCNSGQKEAYYPYPPAYVYIDLWVERVSITKDETSLSIAASIYSDKRHTFDKGYLVSAEGAYVTDSRGDVYDLLNKSGWFSWASNSTERRAVRRDEVYRFNLSFNKLQEKSPYIVLHYPWHPDIRVDLQWKK